MSFRPFLGWPSVPVHKARCDYCRQSIVWSRKRRQWLALAPASAPTPLQRRMTCHAADKQRHDPRANLYERALARLGLTAAEPQTTVREGQTS